MVVKTISINARPRFIKHVKVAIYWHRLTTNIMNIKVLKWHDRYIHTDNHLLGDWIWHACWHLSWFVWYPHPFRFTFISGLVFIILASIDVLCLKSSWYVCNRIGQSICFKNCHLWCLYRMLSHLGIYTKINMLHIPY